MLPDRVSNPGPLTYESGALPIALRGPASIHLQLRSIHLLLQILIIGKICLFHGLLKRNKKRGNSTKTRFSNSCMNKEYGSGKII